MSLYYLLTGFGLLCLLIAAVAALCAILYGLDVELVGARTVIGLYLLALLFAVGGILLLATGEAHPPPPDPAYTVTVNP